MMLRKIASFVCFLPTLLLAIVARIMPRKRKKIIFGAWCGRVYGCNPKALFEYILAHDLSYECVWIGDQSIRWQVLKIKGAKFAKKGSFSAMWHCLTASYYVCNISHHSDIGGIPDCGQVHILSLGHGIANKCCGSRQLNGKGEHKGSPCGNRIMVRLIKWMYPPITWRSVASDCEGKILCREFAGLSPDRILPFGYCRDDFLIQNKDNLTIKMEIKNKLASLMGIDPNKKWYLYAPTWRHEVKNCFFFNKSENAKKYNELFSKKNVVLIERPHPKIIEQMGLSSSMSGSMFLMGSEVSAKIDIQELLLATDLLISDYSSIYFDFALLDRPVVEFTYDYEFARDIDFGFEIDLREYAPGYFAYTEEELIELLSKSTYELMSGRTQKFLDYMVYEKGTACESLLKFIDKKVKSCEA